MKRSRFTEDQIIGVLKEHQAGIPAAELCRKHNLKPQLLGHWKAAVLERLHTVFEDSPQTSQDQLRIAELEQLVGRQAYELEILKKASRMLGGPAPSNGRSS